MLVVHQGFAARLLLRTDILPTLLAGGANVVVLTPNHEEPYMREELESSRIALEPLRAPVEPNPDSRVQLLFYYLRNYTLAGGHRLRALQEKYGNFRRMARGRSRLADAMFRVALAGLWRSRPLRRLFLALDARISHEELHADVFERRMPDLVVATSPGWFWEDAVVLREATRRGIRTATVVLSWDNPTSKGYRAVMPERVLTWSQPMADQVVAQHDYPANRVQACGVPHFDHYRRPGALPDRAELCRELGLDPDLPIIVFATSSPGMYDHNPEVAEALARACADGSLGRPAQLVVRLHPNNFRPGRRGIPPSFEAVRARHPHVAIDAPEVRSDKLRIDMAASDRVQLGALIRHCDVLVNVFSTTTLEALLVDRPTVLLAASVGAKPGAEPGNSEGRRFSEYAHIRSVLDAPAARVAETVDEMIELTARYLADPALDRPGRAEIAARELGPTDGHAGERVGRLLLELVALPS